MNKLVKGSIAGAAGIALLLGGAGSLALWNASADITDTTVNSGTMTLTTTAGSWTGPTLMVPGDVATYASTVTINATGQNIKATLELDEGTLASNAFADDLDIVFATGTSSLVDNGDGTFDVPAAGTYVVPVTVTVTFEETSVNPSQNKSVSLNDFTFKLTQHR